MSADVREAGEAGEADEAGRRGLRARCVPRRAHTALGVGVSADCERFRDRRER